jgi:TonB family protein
MNFKVKQTDGRIENLLIDESRKLGRGATATVYKVQFNGKDLAAKIYHSGRVFNKTKIQAMLDYPPQNCEVIQNGQEYPQFAWPQFLVLDENNVEVGFLMPLVDANESFTLDYYYDPGLFKKLRSQDESALSYKLEIAKNLSLLVADLHRQGHFIIDCKPQNIRVFRRNHVVTLIDCDGFSVNGKGNRFPAELLSTDYIAPEAQLQNSSPAELNEFQDRYALAVILFQLLNRGTHPFQGILSDNSISANTNDEKAALKLYPHGTHLNPKIKPRPQSTHHLWPAETRALFDQAFTSTFPSGRPSASVWAKHFDTLLATKTLVRCDKFPGDTEHIRFRDLDCPACYLKNLQIFKPSKQPKTVPQPIPTPPLTTISPTALKPQKKSSDSSFIGWAIFIGIVIISWIFFKDNAKAPPAPTSNSTNKQSTSGATNTTSFNSQESRLIKYSPDSNESNNLDPIARKQPSDLRRYTGEIIQMRSAPDKINTPNGFPVKKIASEYVSVGWSAIKSGQTSLYSIGYWANYEALKLGHPEGASNLGYMHEFGLGVPVDYKKAAYWYEKTISLGQPHSAQAEIHLANLIQDGKLGPINLDRSLKLLRDAQNVANLSAWSDSRNEYLIAINKAISENSRLQTLQSSKVFFQPDKLVQDLQTALNEKGFNAGVVDGLIGPQTQAAITEALRVLGMNSNGEPSNRLLNALKAMPSQDLGSRDAQKALDLITGKAKLPVLDSALILQVMSHESADEAQRQREKLLASGMGNVFVDGAVNVNGIYKYRVRVGPFMSREEAQAAQLRARSLGYNTAFINSYTPAPAQAPRASEGGYGAQVRSCVQPGVSFSVPTRSGSANPSAQYRVDLRPDGTIAGVKLTNSSGNPNFDRAVETGIRRCSPFPAPPSGRYPGFIEINYNMYD